MKLSDKLIEAAEWWVINWGNTNANLWPDVNSHMYAIYPWYLSELSSTEIGTLFLLEAAYQQTE